METVNESLKNVAKALESLKKICLPYDELSDNQNDLDEAINLLEKTIETLSSPKEKTL